MMEDKQFIRKLNLLFAFSKGAETRRMIVDALKQRPRNANQLAIALSYNYRTIKHHTNILKREEMISEISQDRYNTVFAISPLLASRMELLAPIFNSERSAQNGHSLQDDKRLYTGLFNGINVGIIITDNNNRVLRTNPGVSRIFGFSSRDEEESRTRVLRDTIFRDKNIVNLLQKKGAVDNYAKEVLDTEGNRHFVLICVSDIQDASSRSIGRCYLVHDIVNYALAAGASGQNNGVRAANPGFGALHAASATAVQD